MLGSLGGGRLGVLRRERRRSRAQHQPEPQRAPHTHGESPSARAVSPPLASAADLISRTYFSALGLAGSSLAHTSRYFSNNASASLFLFRKSASSTAKSNNAAA